MEDSNTYNLLSLNSALSFKYPLEWSGGSLSPWVGNKFLSEIINNNSITIVECGSGTSTVIAAKLLEKRGFGKIYAFEDSEIYYNKTLNKLKAEGVSSHFYQLKHTPIKDKDVEGEVMPWYEIDNNDVPNNIDLILVDGPLGSLHRISRYPALNFFYEKCSKKFVVLLDDHNRDAEKEIGELWEKKFKLLHSETYPDYRGLRVFYFEK